LSVRWISAAPFILAIVFLLIAPSLIAKVETAVIGQTASVAQDLHIDTECIPPHLNDESIKTLIDYAADAVQIVPITLLPVTGALFAVATKVPNIIALGYLLVSVIVAVVMDAWVLSQSAGRYVSRTHKRYSVVTIVAIVSNLLGLAMVILYT
jgi:hypothetical protein